ncbi:MAG TPA: hypothetical protein VF187_06410, partial [Gemmatimonadales bacterium]
TNRLIRDGAAPLLELEDLLAHYPEIASRAARRAPAATGTLSALETRIVNALWTGPRQAQELIEATEAPVCEALDALSTLELAGRVRLHPGGLYQLVAPRLF